MSSRAIFLAATCAIAALIPFKASATEACATGSAAQPAVKLGPLQVERCYAPYDATEQAALKSMDNYYGQVLMTVSGGASMELDKSFGRVLAAFFGVKSGFTAVVTVSVYVRIAGEDVLVYEKPVYSISRENDGKTSLSTTIVGGTAISASPLFALDGSNGEVHTQLKVALVNSRKLDALPVIKEGVNLAAMMGGPASLVTKVGEPAFLAIASRVQATYQAVLSDEETSNFDTVLKFDRINGLKSVEYKVNFPVPHGQSSTVNVNLSLTTRESLISPASAFRTDAAGAKWPDQANLGIGRWADRITLSTRTGPGVTITTLSSALDQQGVPQKLEELSVADGASDQVSRRDAVNKSCRALLSALQKGPYRLNETDAQLILFNELDQGRVFERYPPSSLPCTAPIVSIWKARYNIEVAAPTVRVISWKAKQARLERVARSWDMPTPALRTISLSEDFAPHDVHMLAPLGFIPGVVVSENPPGFQRFDVATSYLAVRKKACFGNFKPTADTDPTATAFVRFEDDPVLYLATIRFDNRSEFVADPGPRIDGLDLRSARATDKTALNQSGSCF